MNASNLDQSFTGGLKLPKLPVDDSQNEQDYVEKLHGHIQFLTQQISEIKGKQDDYKKQMMGIISKD